MSWQLIRSIQQTTDLRLILPFGLNVHNGDVIGVGKTGVFTLEGTCRSLLGMEAGMPIPGQAPAEILQQSGQDAQYTFRQAGSASTLFPELPTAQAGFDISFGSAESWLLAARGRTIDSLGELHRFRRPILDAYRRNVWRPDWALVVSVARVEKMTLLASASRNTKLALSLGAEISPNAATEVKLTADVSIVATNQQLVQCIASHPITAFCTALRVKDSWWRSPDIGTLARGEDVPLDAAQASDDEFWEDVDDIK